MLRLLLSRSLFQVPGTCMQNGVIWSTAERCNSMRAAGTALLRRGREHTYVSGPSSVEMRARCAAARSWTTFHIWLPARESSGWRHFPARTSTLCERAYIREPDAPC
ncbi:uncharacterized protein LOC125034320 [Penaeus chinensis]|uniref:uncharacterized protein LOC125034320 n=1 Tax=Penaeus chinensis TaxID=139456 RepID=UPI001FB7FFCA|nr:uncharacterized protein LOC125034320 [Penaeus chinensis]